MATVPDTLSYWGWGGQSREVCDESRWVWIRHPFSSPFLLPGILCFLALSPNKNMVISFVLGMINFIFGIRTWFLQASVLLILQDYSGSISHLSHLLSLTDVTAFSCTLFTQPLERFPFAPLGLWLFFIYLCLAVTKCC